MRRIILRVVGASIIAGCGAQSATAEAIAQGSSTVSSTAQTCDIEVWQSKIFPYSNRNAIGGILGAVIQKGIDEASPPKSVKEQLEQDLSDNELFKTLTGLDWSQFIGTKTAVISLRDGLVEKNTIRLLEKNQLRNYSSTANCYIEIYVEKLAFLGGMKTWFVSDFSVRYFNAGEYISGHGREITHVKNFPSISADMNALAVSEIQSGFVRNLTKFLHKKLAGRT